MSRHDDAKAIILIAETDWEKPTNDCPMGYYQTVFAVGGKASKGKIDIAQWLEFDAFHDMKAGWSMKEKRLARHRATLAAAREYVDTNLEIGRYA